MAQALRPPRFGGRTEAARQHITRSDLFLHPRHFRGRHHAAAIIVVLLLAVVGFRLFPGKDVTVLNGGKSVRVSSTFAGKDALAAAAVSLQPGDRVLRGSDGNYVSLAVQRARPVQVEVDGRLMEVRTQATTVSGALATAGVELLAGDRVYIDGKLGTLRGPLFAGPSDRSVSLSPGVSRTASAVTIRVKIERARALVVYIDTFRLETNSAAETVAGVLEDLGMTVREGDLVRPGLDAAASSGMTIRLAKARTVTVRVDGKEQSLYTQAGTVSEILALLGIAPGPEDLVEPAGDTPVANGMLVTIGLTRTVTETETEPVPPAIVYETDPALAAGQVRIIEGTPGTRVRNFTATYKNGELVFRVPAPGGGITVEPVATRQVSGTRGAAPPSTTGSAANPARPTMDAPGYSGSYRQKVTVFATWYNASQGAYAPGDPNYGRTASGAIVDYGICAVDRSVFPLGTRFYIPGYGECLAADVGGGIRGYSIDVGFPESAGNNPWRTQTLEVYVLD